jgi:cation diffusion facilitator family transporter
MHHGRHSHKYVADSAAAEKRTRIVIAITATMMVIEIVAGIAYNSMALLADGWHMSTHVSAFLIAAFAYYFSRRYAADPGYSFGTGKMGVLGGFASAAVLMVIAFFMAGESLYRIFSPQAIRFDEAIFIATIGLGVNLACALIFKGVHADEHALNHHHGLNHHHDLNLRAAYLHVLADALTSLTAIIALVAGKYLGWSWLDPVMGIVGSIIVAIWGYGLLRDTSGILLDRTPDSSDLPDEIRRAVENDGDAQISDLHIWQVGAGKFAAIVSIVGHAPKTIEEYRRAFCQHEELVHVTIEINICQDQGLHPCVNA